MAEEEMIDEKFSPRTCQDPERKQMMSHKETSKAQEAKNAAATEERRCKKRGRQSEVAAEESERQQRFTTGSQNAFTPQVIEDLIQQASQEAFGFQR